MFFHRIFAALLLFGRSLAMEFSYKEMIEYRIIKIPLEKHHRHKSVVGEDGRKVQISLKNDENVAYSGIITVGTPGTKFRVNFDTGSSDLWIASRRICRNDPEYCFFHNVYNNKISDTYSSHGDNFYLHYGSEKIFGFVSEDDIEVSGHKVKSQLFGEATYIECSYKYTDQKDGIFGLAYPELGKITNRTILINMIQQGILKQPVFAFYLNRNDPLLSAIRTAELVLGGVDPAHYVGSINYFPVVLERHWTIQANGFFVGQTKVLHSFLATVDSGSTGIVGPRHHIHNILQLIFGNSYDTSDSSTLTSIDCSTIGTLPNISVVIRDETYVLNPEDYIIKDYFYNLITCSAGFQVLNDYDAIVLGDVFMRKYYTVFDMGKNQVGFATAK